MRDVEQTRRISRRKQYELLKLGKIKAKKCGLHTLIDLPSVDEYQASLPDYAPAEVRSCESYADRLIDERTVKATNTAA
jgi:hypothetical protein